MKSSTLAVGMLAIVVTAAAAEPAWAQPHVPPLAPPISLAGPRVGVTMLSDGIVETLQESGIEIGPAVTQFGWQFEKRFYSNGHGLSAVSEWVVLAGGLEQGVMLPSISWLVGLRNERGVEFGVGPNVTPAGTALALAAGVTFRAGAINIPANVAVVPSRTGWRVSVLTGFNTRR